EGQTARRFARWDCRMRQVRVERKNHMSKRIRVSVRAPTCTHYTIEPVNGFTAEQIVDMLNKGEVSLRAGSDSITLWRPPSLGGDIQVAKVYGHTVERGYSRWEVAPRSGNDQHGP